MKLKDYQKNYLDALLIGSHATINPLIIKDINEISCDVQKLVTCAVLKYNEAFKKYDYMLFYMDVISGIIHEADEFLNSYKDVYNYDYSQNKTSYRFHDIYRLGAQMVDYGISVESIIDSNEDTYKIDYVGKFIQGSVFASEDIRVKSIEGSIVLSDKGAPKLIGMIFPRLYLPPIVFGKCDDEMTVQEFINTYFYNYDWYDNVSLDFSVFNNTYNVSDVVYKFLSSSDMNDMMGLFNNQAVNKHTETQGIKWNSTLAYDEYSYMLNENVYKKDEDHYVSKVRINGIKIFNDIYTNDNHYNCIYTVGKKTVIDATFIDRNTNTTRLARNRHLCSMNNPLGCFTSKGGAKCTPITFNDIDNENINTMIKCVVNYNSLTKNVVTGSDEDDQYIGDYIDKYDFFANNKDKITDKTYIYRWDSDIIEYNHPVYDIAFVYHYNESNDNFNLPIYCTLTVIGDICIQRTSYVLKGPDKLASFNIKSTIYIVPKEDKKIFITRNGKPFNGLKKMKEVLANTSTIRYNFDSLMFGGTSMLDKQIENKAVGAGLELNGNNGAPIHYMDMNISNGSITFNSDISTISTPIRLVDLSDLDTNNLSGPIDLYVASSIKTKFFRNDEFFLRDRYLCLIEPKYAHILNNLVM